MTVLINAENPAYVLGITSMDETHLEFIELVNQLGKTDNKTHFIELFETLSEHTKAHFNAEDQLMKQTNFPAIHEHMVEHLRVLGELNRLTKKLKQGSTMMAKSYVTEHIPNWFNLHAATMDSALAAHLKIQKKVIV